MIYNHVLYNIPVGIGYLNHHWIKTTAHFRWMPKITKFHELVNSLKDVNHNNNVPGSALNTLKPKQNGGHFPDEIFKSIFVNENVRISNNISLNFVAKGPINNMPALVRIMAWHRPGDKPLSEPMLVSLLTQTCVIRLQWVKFRINSHEMDFLHGRHAMCTF